MAIIKADADKMIYAGEEIKRLTSEYDALIDELYNKLSTINRDCWVSENADLYVSKLRSDKMQNKMVSNNLNSYANFLKSSGNQINNIMKKWNNS